MKPVSYCAYFRVGCGLCLLAYVRRRRLRLFSREIVNVYSDSVEVFVVPRDDAFKGGNALVD